MITNPSGVLSFSKSIYRRRKQRTQTTKPYRVLSTSKQLGTQTRRCSDGSLVTVDTRPNEARRQNVDPT